MAAKDQDKTPAAHEVRGAILDAFRRKGGADWLFDLAGSEPRTFLSLLSKLLASGTGSDGPLISDLGKLMKRIDGKTRNLDGDGTPKSR